MYLRLVKLVLTICFLLFQNYSNAARSISIKIETSEKNGHRNLVFFNSPLSFANNVANWSIDTIFEKDGKFSHVYEGKMPLLLHIDSVSENPFDFICEPGDDITVKISDSRISVIGFGADKFNLVIQLNSLFNSIQKPNTPYYKCESLADYQNWNRYSDYRLKELLQLVDSYEGKISMFAHSYIRANLINAIEFERAQKFQALRLLDTLSTSDLSFIMDSTLNKPAAVWLRKYTGSINDAHYLDTYNFLSVFRKLNFDFTNDPLASQVKRRAAYYYSAKLNFRGEVRDKILTYLITRKVIDGIGLGNITDTLLKDFYNTVKDTLYSSYVKKYFRDAERREGCKLGLMTNLIREDGSKFSVGRIKGKIVLFDFWFTGCIGCIEMAPYIKALQERYSKDTSVVFVSINIDKSIDVWRESLKLGRYTNHSQINLNTNGMSNKQPLISEIGIVSYPYLYLINSNGIPIVLPVPDPRIDSGREISNLIDFELNNIYDGPYVLYESAQNIGRSILDNIEVIRTNGKLADSVFVRTDVTGRKFSVHLKDTLTIEPCIFEKPKKVFSVSDIEGNFRQFRKLLQANKVIDQKLMWTFGDGHLVLIGDFFDRGNQVTECLWLIYSLEAQARLAGGYVHFILGNHEIMNMAGDHRYNHKKYVRVVNSLQIKYDQLFSMQTELGRWLRTKNIMERIGSVLYVHGGVSKELIDSNLSVESINNIFRRRLKFGPWLSDVPKVLFDEVVSPVWYRGYFNSTDKYLDTLLDRTLSRFNVERVIVGHTIVGETVTSHVHGRVINIDTKHSRNISEGLLIENNAYYRVNDEGKKMSLF